MTNQTKFQNWKRGGTISEIKRANKLKMCKKRKLSGDAKKVDMIKKGKNAKQNQRYVQRKRRQDKTKQIKSENHSSAVI